MMRCLLRVRILRCTPLARPVKVPYAAPLCPIRAGHPPDPSTRIPSRVRNAGVDLSPYGGFYHGPGATPDRSFFTGVCVGHCAAVASKLGSIVVIYLLKIHIN